jgi:hypothetical protein
VIREVLGLAGLTGPDQELPDAIRVRHGTVRGRRLHYFLNSSGMAQSLTYAYAGGEDLLSAKPLARGEKLTLGPWGVAIVAETAR